jgi:hypothetical protein
MGLSGVWSIIHNSSHSFMVERLHSLSSIKVPEPQQTLLSAAEIGLSANIINKLF